MSRPRFDPVEAARLRVIEHLTVKHQIKRRLQWGARRPDYRTMERDWDYTTVVIHHSGNGGEKDPQQIETKHMVDRGWADVGYHYLIQPTGKIHEGRDLRYKGSHVESANTSKLGILMMGDFNPNWWDFDDDDLSPPQIEACTGLIRSLRSAFPTLHLLGGHPDYKKTTECPGDVMYTHLATLRKSLQMGGP